MGKRSAGNPGRWSRMLDWLGWPASGKPQHHASKRTEPVDYRVYILSKNQFAVSAAIGCAAAYCAGYIFYRSAVAASLLAVAGLVGPRLQQAALLRQRRERLQGQFRQLLASMAASLAAGRSVENAIAAGMEDLKLLYPDPNTDIIVELQRIHHSLGNGEQLEKALRGFSSRTDMEELIQFVDVFATCKRYGGDLIEVIRRTSQLIGDKLEVQQELVVLIAQKKFEARVMMAIPFLFLAFLGYAAPDYMAPLYSGFGYLILTVALAVLFACFMVIRRIVSFKI